MSLRMVVLQILCNHHQLPEQKSHLCGISEKGKRFPLTASPHNHFFSVDIHNDRFGKGSLIIFVKGELYIFSNLGLI